jgi:hypothetical protein
MGLGNWFQDLFGTGRASALCERCFRLLPVVGSHFNKQAADGSKAIEAHGRLVRRAWRSAYPPEGGEALYQCLDCGSWWAHQIWTCVPQERLARCRMRSIEAWVKKWSCGEVVK